MSAPTALEAGALRRGIATWAGRSTPKRPRGPSPAQERRSAHPVAVLGRRHDELCRQACDPYEIAAVLEAEGLDDRRARAEFDAAGVFELAEWLYALVPWRPQAPEPQDDPWHLPLWRAQLRGVLYAVPAVTAALLPLQITGTGGRLLLAAGTVTPIAAGQAVSVLGHLLLGRGQRAAFAQLARAALVLAALACVVAAGAALLLAGPGRAALAGALGLQLVLVVGATLLLVPRREAWLAAVGLPGALGAGAAALFPAALSTAPFGRWAQPGLATACVVTVAAVALISAGRTGPQSGWLAALRGSLGKAERALAGTAAGYGVGLAATVSFAAVACAAGTVHADGSRLVLVTLPLTTTVGTSEYLLHRARGRASRVLAGLAAVGAFGVRARRELRAMLARQAVVVLAVTVAVVSWVDRSGRQPELEALTAGYALLSLGLLLASTLLSLGHHTLAARLVLTAGGGLVIAAVLPIAAAPMLVVAAFLVLAYRVGVTRFVAVTAHR